MKTEQVRIPVDVAKDGRMVAAALDESLPEYVTRVVREALRRDMPKALKIMQKRAAEQGDHQKGE